MGEESIKKFQCYSLNISLCLHFTCRENRYLLFLTENYAALDILKHYIRGKDQEPSTTGDAEGSTVSQKPFTLFGSSFPKDREYTQVLEVFNIIW
jgi:hypothetical protein